MDKKIMILEHPVVKKSKKKKKTRISIRKVTILLIILISLIVFPFVSCSEDFNTERNRAMKKDEIIYHSSVFTPSDKERAERPYPIIDKKTGFYYFSYNKTVGSWNTKLTEAIYEDAFCSTGFFTGDNKTKIYIAAVKKDGKWGYIKFSETPSGKMQIDGDSDNGFVIQPLYESAEPFYNGIAAVKLSGLYGFISIDGKYIIEPQYLDVRYYNEGLIPIKNSDSWYYADTNGKMILGPYEQAESFSGDFALVMQDGLWGYINKDGSYAIEPTYQDGWEVKYNKAWVLENDIWKKIKVN